MQKMITDRIVKHDGYTNLQKTKALKVFDLCRKELRPVGDGWENPDALVLHILHDGKWKRVVRTDNKDDVGTFSFEIERNTEVYYRDRIRYGVRFNDRSFCCIDAYSDG